MITVCVERFLLILLFMLWFFGEVRDDFCLAEGGHKIVSDLFYLPISL